MRKPFRASKPASLIALVCLAACGGARDANAPPAKMMMAVSIPAGANYSAADVDFMQGMIAHHAQAIVMAAMAPTHGASPAVATLCRKITISQNDEIAMMQAWLKERNQRVPDPKDPHPMMMPGMLAEQQIGELDKARGATFDSLFLTGMIHHHEGAVRMVADLFASGGGQPSEMFRYASDVDADQRAEIKRMQSMLNPTTRSTEQ